MSALLLIVLAIVIFVAAYLTYGRYLAKTWGIDPSRTTPAHEMEDGVDYVPAKTAVLMGHHFSSIAGAGPINGPIQAAFFGWVPCFLWIVIGGIFFGAVQDFSSIFISIRHKGLSLGEVIEENIGKKARVLFTVFAWLVLLLVIAAFADIVANSFMGGSEIVSRYSPETLRCNSFPAVYSACHRIRFPCIQEECTDAGCYRSRRRTAGGMCGTRSGIPHGSAEEFLDRVRICLHHDRVRSSGLDSAAAQGLFKFFPALCNVGGGSGRRGHFPCGYGRCGRSCRFQRFCG